MESNDLYIEEFWHKVMKNITLGFAMTIMTLNFWGLQYVLPAIGVVLIFSGFSELRKENKALKKFLVRLMQNQQEIQS